MLLLIEPARYGNAARLGTCDATGKYVFGSALADPSMRGVVWDLQEGLGAWAVKDEDSIPDLALGAARQIISDRQHLPHQDED